MSTHTHYDLGPTVYLSEVSLIEGHSVTTVKGRTSRRPTSSTFVINLCRYFSLGNVQHVDRPSTDLQSVLANYTFSVQNHTQTLRSSVTEVTTWKRCFLYTCKFYTLFTVDFFIFIKFIGFYLYFYILGVLRLSNTSTRRNKVIYSLVTCLFGVLMIHNYFLLRRSKR